MGDPKLSRVLIVGTIACFISNPTSLYFRDFALGLILQTNKMFTITLLLGFSGFTLKHTSYNVNTTYHVEKLLLQMACCIKSFFVSFIYLF